MFEFFLLVLEESQERDTSNLGNFETNSGNITYSMTFTTEPRNKYFIIIIAISQTTIARDESSDLLTVLNKLNTDTFTNSGVRLFSFNTNLFCDNTLSMGRTPERRISEDRTEGN